MNYFKNPVVQWLMTVLSWLYGVVIRMKRLLYSSGISKSRKLPVKTVCVGNITVGGSGKTPAVLALAKYFKDKNKKVAVISRGYKHASEKRNEILRPEQSRMIQNDNRLPVIVCDGEKILSTPEISGDEPFLLAQKLADIPVIVCPDRYTAGMLAVEKYHSEIVLLDDGFQHWKLKRDLDVVCIDATIPLEDEKLFPAGILREPVSALNRAGIIVLTHIDMVTNDEHSRWYRYLNKICPSIPVVETKHKIKSLKNMVSKDIIPTETLNNEPVILMSSLGNNSGFMQTVTQNMSANIVHHYCFPDHHFYKINDLEPVVETIKTKNVKVLTTEKDAIRLLPLTDSQQYPWFNNFYVLEIELEIVTGTKIWDEKLSQL